MTSRRPCWCTEQCSKMSFGNLILLLWKTCGAIFCCFVHQHGGLITWMKTKNWGFAYDVTAAMLVYRTMQQNVFWEFDSIIMENLWGHFLLFCTPTWPSNHVDADQELLPCHTARTKIGNVAFFGNCCEYSGNDKILTPLSELISGEKKSFIFFFTKTAVNSELTRSVQ